MEANRKLVSCVLKEELKKHGIKTVAELVGPKVDRKKLYRIFELVTCLVLGALPWELLPPNVLSKVKAVVRYRANGIAQIPDYGIDSAILNHRGDAIKMAIQSKWYAANSTICFTNISTFFTYSTAVSAQQKVIITSENVKLHVASDNLPIVHKFLKEPDIVKAVAPLLGRPAQVDRHSYALNLQSKTPGPVDVDEFLDEMWQEAHRDEEPEMLRGYQKDAVRVVCEKLETPAEEPANVRVCMACGTGKTRVMAGVMLKQAETTEIHRWAVMTPTKSLMHQIAASLRGLCPTLVIACVGDHQRVNPDADVFVCIYNSVKHIARYQYQSVLVDEAHHVARAFTEEDLADEVMVDTDSDSDSDDDDEKEDRTTEEVPDTKEESEPEEKKTIVEEEETRRLSWAQQIKTLQTPGFVHLSASLGSGNGIDYAYPMERGIEEGFLSDYVVAIPVFTPGNIKKQLAGLILDQSFWTRVLAYCNSIKEAQEFAKILNAIGVSAKSFDGTTSLAVRNKIIQEFTDGDLRAIVTVRVLSEGIDIPRADACVFVEPRGSAIDVEQCIGRVLRLCPEHGKQLAHVVLPTTADPQEQLVKYLRILHGQDSRILPCLKSGNRGRISFIRNSSEPVDEKDAEFKEMELYNRLGGQVQNNEWLRCYELVKKYVEEFEQLPPEGTRYGEELDETDIGTWVANRKSDRNKLTPDQIKMLESLAPWKWPRSTPSIARTRADPEKAWDGKHKSLSEYLTTYKKPPPESYRPDGLGSWIRAQKRFRRIGSLPEDKVKRLEALKPLGWVWTVPKGKKATKIPWEDHYNVLVAAGDLKSAIIPTPTKDWMKRQRKRYRKKSSKLLPSQIKKLSELPGWNWTPASEAAIAAAKDSDGEWKRKIHLLRGYMTEHKKRPPHPFLIGKDDIGGWANNFCSRKEALSADRHAEVSALPGWEWPGKNENISAGKQPGAWKTGFDALKEYIEEHKVGIKINLPPKGHKSYTWLGNQRSPVGWARLTEDQKADITALNIPKRASPSKDRRGGKRG